LYVGIIALSLLISTVASITQIGIVDEDSKVARTDKIILSQLSMYETMGVNEDFMDEMEDQIREKTADMLNPGSMISGSVFNFIIYFLIALMPDVILKRN